MERSGYLIVAGVLLAAAGVDAALVLWWRRRNRLRAQAGHPPITFAGAVAHRPEEAALVEIPSPGSSGRGADLRARLRELGTWMRSRAQAAASRIGRWRATRRESLPVEALAGEMGAGYAHESSQARPPAWRALWADELVALRILAVIACLLFVLGMAFAYARDIGIKGWQIPTWVICCGIVVACALPRERPALERPRGWAWLALLGVVALVLRVVALDRIPGGLHIDEEAMSNFSNEHVWSRSDLTISPFVTGWISHPALYFFLVRFSKMFSGHPIVGPRLLNAVLSPLAVLVTYALVTLFENRRTGLIAAALLTTYHYHIHYSRLALNNVWDSIWLPLTIGLYVWGWRKRWSGGAALAGLSLGLSQYFYFGTRVLPLLLLFVMLLLWRQNRDTRRLWIYLLKLGAVALCVLGPLLVFALRNPDLFGFRMTDLFVFSPKVQDLVEREGGMGPYMRQHIWHTLGTFLLFEDDTTFYAPGRPILFGLPAVLFLIGLCWTIGRRRNWVPVLWIALTLILGGFLTIGPLSTTHYLGLTPVMSWLIALPLSWLFERGWRKLVLGVIVAIMVWNVWFYFFQYRHWVHHLYEDWGGLGRTTLVQ